MVGCATGHEYCSVDGSSMKCGQCNDGYYGHAGSNHGKTCDFTCSSIANCAVVKCSNDSDEYCFTCATDYILSGAVCVPDPTATATGTNTGTNTGSTNTGSTNTNTDG